MLRWRQRRRRERALLMTITVSAPSGQSGAAANASTGRLDWARWQSRWHRQTWISGHRSSDTSSSPCRSASCWRGVVHRAAMSRPSRPKMPEDVGLRRRAVDVVLRAPVVFGDAGRGARVVACSPSLADAEPAGRLIVDPRLVHVRGIPERPRRSVAPQLHRVRHVVAELAALRIVVDREDVEQARAGGDVVLPQRVEEPRQVVRAAVIAAIGQEAPAVRAAVLLVDSR